MQIRQKLSFKFFSITSGILIVALGYIYIQFYENLKEEQFEKLKSKSIMVSEMASYDSVGIQRDFSKNQNHSDAYKVIYNENVAIYSLLGNRVYTFIESAPIHPDELIRSVVTNTEIRQKKGENLIYGLRYTNRSGEEYILISEAVFNTIHLDNLKMILLWVLLLSTTLIAIGGWILAGQALKPLNSIMNQVDSIIPSGNNAKLTSLANNDELARLVDTFNRLLDRVQYTIQNQKLFLSNVSHELKTPLNVIISKAEVSSGRERSLTEYKVILDSIVNEARELNETCDKLLQLSKLENDISAIPFNFHRIDETVWQVKTNLLRAHPEYKIKFEILNLPEDVNKLLIQSNEHLLKTAIYNLLDNGCKFSPDKSAKIVLTILDGKSIEVTIQDNGIGIDEEEHGKILEPFYRGTNGIGVKGAGIGLALVKSILRLHNFELKISSHKNIGSEFSIIIPITNSNDL